MSERNGEGETNRQSGRGEERKRVSPSSKTGEEKQKRENKNKRVTKCLYLHLRTLFTNFPQTNTEMPHYGPGALRL